MQKATKPNTGSRKKNRRGSPKFNDQVIDRLVEKYGLSKRFIKMSIDGDRKSETSTTIKKDYHSLVKKFADAVKTALK